MTLTATEWFDQFVPHLESRHGVQGGEQWCARHWAPCPLLHGNGIGAAADLISRFINAHPGINGPTEMQAKMEELSPLCCWLGDQEMYDLWGKWPPVNYEPREGSDA